MNLLSLKSILLLIFIAFSAFNCGDKSTSETTEDNLTTNSASEETSSTSSAASKVGKFDGKPCELLTEAVIRKQISTSETISQEVPETRKMFGKTITRCLYSWTAPEKEQTEEEKEIDALIDQLNSIGGEVSKGEPTKHVVEIAMFDNEETASEFASGTAGYTDELIEQRTQSAVETAKRRNEVARMKPAERE